ncbi:hypothetical protein COCNU_scaffold000934G000020 [Cocos nucifera]|nr:hypothetical protein [Cocos nucifera]
MPKVVDYMIDLEPWQLIWGSLGNLFKSDHQMFTHIKRAHHLKAEAEKVQEDLRARSDHQMFTHIKRAHHLKAEAEKVQEDLRARGALRKVEFISVGLKAALALEEERKKEAEIKVTKLKAWMAKSISEAMIQAVEEFKASSKMRNLNVEFGQKCSLKVLSSVRAEFFKNFLS